jgi:2-C-methyl-D-erythritol 4-phosphate cytidylyltransferase
MTNADDVDAIVLAAGHGHRLGLGPKAWLVLDGRTLLDRAVATMRRVAGHVSVGAAADDLERARTACEDDVRVVLGGSSHRETMIQAFRAGHAPLVLIHDVAHPFVTPDLARDVIETARTHGAAVAAVPSMSSAYHDRPGMPRRRLGPREVWLIRRPFACRRADFARVLEAIEGDEGLSTALDAVGVRTQVVPAPPWNIKITTPDDWALARAIAESLRPE